MQQGSGGGRRMERETGCSCTCTMLSRCPRLDLHAWSDEECRRADRNPLLSPRYRSPAPAKLRPPITSPPPARRVSLPPASLDRASLLSYRFTQYHVSSRLRYLFILSEPPPHLTKEALETADAAQQPEIPLAPAPVSAVPGGCVESLDEPLYSLFISPNTRLYTRACGCLSLLTAPCSPHCYITLPDDKCLSASYSVDDTSPTSEQSRMSLRGHV